MVKARVAAFLTAAAVTVASVLPAAAETTIRVASFTPEGAVGVRFVMKPWMEAVQAELGDRVNLVPFWGGALGPNPFDQFDLVRTGVVDVAWVLSGYTPGQFPQINITELPFGVASGEEGSVVGWRLIEEGLIGGLEDVHVLTFWTPDITNIHLREPLTSLDDLNGTSLRAAGQLQSMFVEAIGAAPQVLSSVEANEGMQRHHRRAAARLDRDADLWRFCGVERDLPRSARCLAVLYADEQGPVGQPSRRCAGGDDQARRRRSGPCRRQGL